MRHVIILATILCASCASGTLADKLADARDGAGEAGDAIGEAAAQVKTARVAVELGCGVLGEAHEACTKGRAYVREAESTAATLKAGVELLEQHLGLIAEAVNAKSAQQAPEGPRDVPEQRGSDAATEGEAP